MEVILDTTTPNTPKPEQDSPPDYWTVSPPPPHLGGYHEASTQNTAPSPDKTKVSGASQTSSQVQWEINQAIFRAPHLIDLDQQAFEGFTYQDLQQIDLLIIATTHIYTPLKQD